VLLNKPELEPFTSHTFILELVPLTVIIKNGIKVYRTSWWLKANRL